MHNINEFQRAYDEYANKLGIVKSDIQATLIEICEYGFGVSIPHYLWLKNSTLHLFPMSKYYKQSCTTSLLKPSISRLHLKSIPIEKILYFEEIGELRKYTTISGGGSSLEKAKYGLLFGNDAAAIILSREPITTEITVNKCKRKIKTIE